MTRKQPSLSWKRTQRLLVVGYGHWGKALGQTFADAGYQISHWGSRSNDWKTQFESPSLVLLSCPFEFVSGYIAKLSKEKNCVGVINASKGIDRKTLMTFSELAKGKLKIPFASLSGPSFADELLLRKPTACSIAGKDKDFLEHISKSVSRPYFRLYVHTDPIGVEVCAAVKNILAIACGISEGLGFGENARAAMLTRALPEMVKLVKTKNGKPASVFGLAGVGDLWLTAAGGSSRNRKLGILLGKGLSLDQALKKIGETVEGVYTLQQIEKLRKQQKLELPICSAVYKVVLKKQSPQKVIKGLMGRELKLEESSAWQLR